MILVDDDSGAATDSTPKYRHVSDKELKKAEQIAVAKISDLDTATGDALHNLLHAWTLVIKDGKRVREVGSKNAKVTKFAPRSAQHCRLHFAESFRAKHRALVQLCIGTGMGMK